MNISAEITLSLVINVLLVGVFAGSVRAQIAGLKEDISRLEKKQDAYNHLKERTARVEESCKSAHRRLNGLGEGVL